MTATSKGTTLRFTPPRTLSVISLALLVSPASEPERAQAAGLAEQVQVATGQTLKLAYIDQGYTGEAPAEAARAQESNWKL